MGYVAKALESRGQLDFWSLPVSVTGLNTSGVDKALGDVVIPDISSIVVSKAYAMMAMRGIINTNGATNYVDGLQYIQVDESAAGYINAIKMPANSYEVLGTTTTLLDGIVIGSIDISTRADVNKTINFKWASAKAKLADLNFPDIKTGVRLVY